MADWDDSAILTCQRLYGLIGVIRTGVVHNDDFDVWEILLGDAADAFRQVTTVVVCGDYDGKDGHSSLFVSRPVVLLLSLHT